MAETFTPFWTETAPSAPAPVALEDDHACDVAIVGGGFTGLRAGLALAEQGLSVSVFEAGQVGHGASGRSGGQVNPMLPVRFPQDLRAAVGDTFFEKLAQVSLASADELFALVRRYQIPCDARQNGWIRTNHCEAARRMSEEAARAWNEHGAGFSFLGGADVARLTGARGYDSAVLSPKGGAVQPLALVRGLARVAQGAGARIFSNAPVTSLRRENRNWTFRSCGFRVSANAVVIATNGYSGDLVPGLKRSVLPLFPIQIATDTLQAHQIGPILAQGHTISDTRRLIMYARREPDDQMVFGAIGYRTPWGGAGGFRWMYKDVTRLFPSLRGVRWRYRWGGQIALTPDRVPHLHEPQPGLFAGLGYNGRGVAMSLVMGRVLAERVLGEAPANLPFPTSPIQSYPYRNVQFLGAGPAMAWLRLRDQFEMKTG